MQYFTLEILDKSLNLSDDEYDKLWMENLTKYWSQFKNYENRLPIRFVKEYCKHAFHDYNIQSINFYKYDTKSKHCYNVELKIELDNNQFLITYIDVFKYDLNINRTNYSGRNIYLYGEILPVDDMKMSHEIILSNKNTVYIEFRKIVFKRIAC